MRHFTLSSFQVKPRFMLQAISKSKHAFYTTQFHHALLYRLVRWSTGSDYLLNTSEPLQSLFTIRPRPPELIVLVWNHERLPCFYMSHRTKGENTRLQNKCSKRARCENGNSTYPVTLLPFMKFKPEILPLGLPLNGVIVDTMKSKTGHKLPQPPLWLTEAQICLWRSARLFIRG